jgi:hypothetical protein
MSGPPPPPAKYAFGRPNGGQRLARLRQDRGCLSGVVMAVAEMAIRPWYGSGMSNGASYNGPGKSVQSHEF